MRRGTAAQDVDPELLEAVGISFCALGVHMTELVEDWILRASERCMELGCDELGVALRGHASAEAGHDHSTRNDARALCARWDSRARLGAGRPPLDPEAVDSMAAAGSAALEAYADFITECGQRAGALCVAAG